MYNFCLKPIRTTHNKLIVAGVTISLLLVGCDVATIKQLGAKVGLRGQDISSSAITTLNNIRDLESKDYAQKTISAVIVTPIDPNSATKVAFPTITHDSLLEQVQLRINAYKQFGKAYEAIQQLSEKNFGEQTQKVASELVNSVTAIKGIPNLPGPVSAAIPAVASIVVETKQANAIKKYNAILAKLSLAYKELWDSDKQLWKSYFDRVKNSYVNSLKSVPDDRFNVAKLKELVGQPFTDAYLVTLYKANESARLDREMQTLQSQIDAVSEAFRLLNKAHEDLDNEKPSYGDVNAMLDRIITILEA